MNYTHLQYARWEVRRNEHLKRLAAEVAVDAVDEGLLPFLERLNKIPGVATEYSCIGHPEKDSNNAYVILDLESRIADAVYHWRTPFLRDAPIPASLDFRYWQEGGETVERVWVNATPENAGETSLPLFEYLIRFLMEISRMTIGVQTHER